MDIPVEVGTAPPGAPSGRSAPGAVRVDAVDHESQVALHIVRRTAILAPVVVVALGLWRGPGAALGAALGLGVVAFNFWLSARLIAWSAPISPGTVMGAVLGGYLVRVLAVVGIALVLREIPVVDLPVFVVTVAAAHIVLLAWELPSVGLTLGAPGLKPRPLSTRSLPSKEQG